MKNSFASFKNRVIQKYSTVEESLNDNKSTNINVLLNRVKLDQKKEKRKKLLFSAAATASVVLFSVLIF